MGSTQVLLSTFEILETFIKELQDIGYLKYDGLSFSESPDTGSVLIRFFNSLSIVSRKLMNSIEILKQSSGLLYQSFTALEEKELNTSKCCESYNVSSTPMLPLPKDCNLISSNNIDNLRYDTISDEFLSTSSCIATSNATAINCLQKYSTENSNAYSATKPANLDNFEVVTDINIGPIITENYKQNIESESVLNVNNASVELTPFKDVESSYIECIKCHNNFKSGSESSLCSQCESLRKLPQNTRKKRVRPQGGHICADCGRKFKMWKHLSIHRKKVHKDAQASNCFPLVTDLYEMNLPVFCCMTCNIACANIQIFNEHICRLPEVVESSSILSNRILIREISKLELVQKFICSTCNIEFRSLSRIIYHLPRCLPGPYNCNFCPQICRNLRSLNYHKKKNHAGEKCFSCDECEKSFQCKASLRKHSILKHESRNGNLPEAQNHLGPFKCELCPKKFIKKIFLTNHKIRMHALNKKFLCQICGNRFLTKSSLSVHMEIHKDHKRFECSHCSKRFRAKEKLQHHERIHTGERPFLCDRCSKAFVSKSRLNEHISRHNGEKRYCCPDCRKSYSAAWDLKQHIKKIHRKEPSAVPVMIIPSNASSDNKSTKQFENEEQPVAPPQTTTFSNINVAPNNAIAIPIQGLSMGQLFQVSQFTTSESTLPIVEHEYPLIGRTNQESLQTFELSVLQQHPNSGIYN